MEVYAFATEFFAYGHSTAVHQILTPGRPNSDTSRERCIMISVTNT
jgi:hypothetical protein